jgi:hypothetical protein
MILILSMGHSEETTNHVMDWLYYYRASFTRINGEDIVEQKQEMSIAALQEQTNVVWFRRGMDLPHYTAKFVHHNKTFID